ncbi:MAG: DNA polymerase I [Bacteroidetes bacterium HGW-Bacteroidetes-12]|nr:MAG: DNA polymerase I [Bacteroidetes bacterium HGW-Bacteroidetes-12]
MVEQKKLFLLDAFALIYRAYFAFGNNQRYNSKGLNTSAMLGFTNTLLEVLEKQKPTHIAVVFDAPAVTNRELEFSDYKAGRNEMPEDIRAALPYIKQIIEAFNIPMLLKDGFEADDVIGTLAKAAEKEGFITYMMTPDKDFGQLVSEKSFIYKPAAYGKPAEVMGIKEVCDKFEIENPLQVIDILGLWGDAVDNIPGIPGIGEKTAKLLIKQYGSVENLIANAEDLKGKQKENVINFAEQGLLSKKLATIIVDVPLEYHFDDLLVEPPNEEKITELFAELEFRNLAKRILGKEIQIQPAAKSQIGAQMDLFGNTEQQAETLVTNSTNLVENELSELKNSANTNHEYFFITTKAQRETLIKKLNAQKSFCFDTETTNINALEAEIVGLSIAYQPFEAYYIPFPENQEETQQILNEFKPLFENKNIEKVGQNIKYDLNVLSNYGITIKGQLFDTMIAHFLIQPDMRHNMDLLAETYLGYKTISIETLIGKKGKNQGNMRDVAPELIVDYACEDADITLQLKNELAAKMNPTLKKILFEIETPLIPVLAAMEQEGINLDVDALRLFSKELHLLILELEKKIIALAGTKFNIDSPKQLGEILFDVLKITDKPKKTKTGQYQTNEDILSKMVHLHEIIPPILEYRTLKKLKSTYVDALPELVNKKTNRLHTSYMQTVASTGRLSSNNPNLQNIPIRSEKGREIRKAFIPKNKDYTLLAADYSQIELRIIAALSGDENMQQAFVNGEDIHAATAAKVFGVALNEVDRDMRSKAKAVNFGIIYGVSAFGLSQNLNISRTEAKEIIDSYFAQYPKIKSYMENNVTFAKENGYVETIMQRRRVLKDITSNNPIVRGHAERNAVNAPIQGSAADVIKIAMINIAQAFKEQQLQSKMLLQVHDELVFDVYKPELETVKAIVKDKMENAVSLSVPLDVEMNNAANWLEAH